MADFSRLLGHGLGVAGTLLQNRTQSALESQNGIGNASVLPASIGPIETAIPHKLGRKPQAVLLGIPSTSETVFQSSVADERFVYLSTASGSTDVTIVVF